MTWVTFDDGAPKHDKLIAAGAPACWLWACGLAHCYRHDSEDGFIPEATVHSKALYPGLGKKEAEALVKVGLWERVEGGYLVHDYLEWKQRRFNGTKSIRGSKGGSVSSEAKSRAAQEREARRRIAREGTRKSTTEHNDYAQPNHNGVTTTTSPTASSSGPSAVPDSLSSLDTERSESFSSPRARPVRPKSLLPSRLFAREYEPLDDHWGYAVWLGLTQGEYEAALRDLRDKHGDRRHDPGWLDDKFCAFLEQVSKSKRRATGGTETAHDRAVREQTERAALLAAQEAAQ